MSEHDRVSEADVATRLKAAFGRPADRLVAEKGVSASAVALAMVGAGLERWLAADRPELVAAGLRALADQIDAAEQPHPSRLAN